MSGKNRPPKTDRKVIDQRLFFKLCSIMQNEFEQLPKDFKSRRDLLVHLAQRLEVPRITIRTWDNAVEATGLPFVFKKQKKQKKQNDRIRVANMLRNVNRAVIDLYQQLGAAPPEPLLRDRDRLDVYFHTQPAPEPAAQTTPAVLPIPVKEVPKPSTIPVANRR